MVVQARLVAAGVAGLKFIRAADAMDFVSLMGFAKVGQTAPETGNLKKHLGSVKGEKFHIAGNLIVLPDIEGDGGVDVALQAGVIRYPAAGPRVVVQTLALLPAVAAALPGIHGAPVVSRIGIGTGRL